MDYTIEQAKSVFDLLRMVSPYAMPLIISMVFPILWVIFKKILGISHNDQQITSSSLSNYEKILNKITSIFSFLKGENGDKFVFYSCILLFILGGMILKIGEKNEERIRQKAIELKKYMEINNSLSMEILELNRNGFNEKTISKIRYNFPNDFVAYSSGKYTMLAIVDTTSVERIKKYVYSLIDSYITAKFQNNCIVYVDSLKNIDYDYNDIRWYFKDWFVYSYLSEKLDKEKYIIDVINGKTAIRKQK